MIIAKKVEGEVDFNDGEFAEVKTIGIEGIEKDLWLDTFQIHREDTDDTPDQFRRRFSIGMRLDIVSTTSARSRPIRDRSGATGSSFPSRSLAVDLARRKATGA